MRTLQIFFFFFLLATPLCAEQALVLTEIEGLQEKIWYLQKDLAAQKNAFGEQQKQIALLSSKKDEAFLNQEEKLAALEMIIVRQQEETSRIGESLDSLTSSLTSFSGGIETQDGVVQKQAEQIGTLKKELKQLRDNFSTAQANTTKALADTSAQLSETRSQLTTMGQSVGSRVEQLSIWGAGVALFLAVALTITFALRRSGSKKSAPELKPPPKHEM